MSDPNTLRILELDGGGERGYLSLNFLQQFVQLWGIAPNSLASQFDVICGASIGGVMALAFASGMSPAQILPFFTVQGPYIFSLSSFIPSLRPNLIAKLALIAADIPFYQSSGPTAANYGWGLFVSTLNNLFGTNTLQSLQTNVVIPSYQDDTSNYVLFSNLNFPSFIGQNELIVNVAQATAAAPIYFPALSLNNHLYIDGGVYMNNPAEFGRVLAQMIKPTATRTCILSLGTGLGEQGFDPGNPSSTDPRIDPKVMAKMLDLQKTMPQLFDSVATIFGLFDIAQTGGQEATAQALYLESQYTLNQLYYYRFQPKLNLDLNTELDNTDPAILTYYQQTATQWFNNDIQDISTFLGHLTA